MSNLGLMYCNGQGGLPKDEKKAVELFKVAAEQGCAIAMSNLGSMYLNGEGGLPKDEKKAVELFKIAAEKSCAEAMSNLGTMYQNSRGGLPKDEKKAAELFKTAAEQGCAIAMSNLGSMYLNGQGGLPKDEKKALELFQNSVNLGCSHALVGLGLMHLEGRGGFSKNLEKALELLQQAADQGVPAAQELLDRYNRRDKASRQLLFIEAIDLNEKIKKASPQKKYSLAVKYYYGKEGVGMTQAERDVIAAKLYKECGLARGKCNLGDMYYDGRAGLDLTPTARDAKAVRLFKESGVLEAKRIIGIMYIQGRAGLDLSPEERQAEAERLFKESGIPQISDRSLCFSHKFDNKKVTLNIKIEKTYAYGHQPVALKTSLNGQILYVANNESQSISIFDTNNFNKLKNEIPINGRSLISLDLSPDGNTLYTLSSENLHSLTGGNITKINTQNCTKLSSISIDGKFPNYLLVSRDGVYLYVSDMHTHKVHKIKSETGEVVSVVVTKDQPTEMTLSKDGGDLYVQCRGGNVIEKIDTQSWRIKDEIVLKDQTPIAHTISHDELIYVGSRSTNSVAAYDAKTHSMNGKKITENISDPRSLALCKNGKILVVANKEASSIVLIDTHTREMIGQPIDIGEMPISICSYEHENGDISIYVANYGDDLISKITICFE